MSAISVRWSLISLLRSEGEGIASTPTSDAPCPAYHVSTSRVQDMDMSPLVCLFPLDGVGFTPYFIKSQKDYASRDDLQHLLEAVRCFAYGTSLGRSSVKSSNVWFIVANILPKTTGIIMPGHAKHTKRVYRPPGGQGSRKGSL